MGKRDKADEEFAQEMAEFKSKYSPEEQRDLANRLLQDLGVSGGLDEAMKEIDDFVDAILAIGAERNIPFPVAGFGIAKALGLVMAAVPMPPAAARAVLDNTVAVVRTSYEVAAKALREAEDKDEEEEEHIGWKKL